MRLLPPASKADLQSNHAFPPGMSDFMEAHSMHCESHDTVFVWPLCRIAHSMHCESHDTVFIWPLCRIDSSCDMANDAKIFSHDVKPEHMETPCCDTDPWNVISISLAYREVSMESVFPCSRTLASGMLHASHARTFLHYRLVNNDSDAPTLVEHERNSTSLNHPALKQAQHYRILIATRPYRRAMGCVRTQIQDLAVHESFIRRSEKGRWRRRDTPRFDRGRIHRGGGANECSHISDGKDLCYRDERKKERCSW